MRRPRSVFGYASAELQLFNETILEYYTRLDKTFRKARINISTVKLGICRVHADLSKSSVLDLSRDYRDFLRSLEHSYKVLEFVHQYGGSRIQATVLRQHSSQYSCQQWALRVITPKLVTEISTRDPSQEKPVLQQFQSLLSEKLSDYETYSCIARIVEVLFSLEKHKEVKKILTFIQLYFELKQRSDIVLKI